MATRALILRPGYFPLFDNGKPISSGYIYIGEPDLDPEIVSNQKAITFLQENGTEVPGSQPVRTSAGGVPTYNGSPVTVLVDGNYSVKVLDKYGSQVYYVPKNADLQDSDIVTKVDTIADLRALTGLADGQVIYATNHTSDGDGGGGEFVVVGDELGETDNNGTLLVIDGKVVERRNYDHPTPSMFGAQADGVTDDTGAFSAAGAVGSVVLVPYSADGYNVADTVVSGGSTFMFEGGSDQLQGSATAADLNGVFVTGGQVGGVPWADALRSSKIGIVAGAIRQDDIDRTKWNYISDTGHIPIGVSGAFATASGGGIAISYDRAYSRVISFIAAPDETLGNVMGVSVGGSVGLSSTTLSASATFNGAFTVEWDGAAWAFSSGTGQNVAPALNTYANGSLRIDHTYCRGIGVQVSPYTAGGAILNPYIPMIKAAGHSYFDIQWMDPTTGNIVTGAESTRMKAIVTKVNNLGLFLDGTNGATTINGVDIANGNIWFFGIFEE